MAGLKIMQCLRAPVGGLFRHVCDLTEMLVEAGHDVGIVCDAGTGGKNADQVFEHLAPKCSLGIHRLSMGRMPGLADFSATKSIAQLTRDRDVDIMHGHGAKGGAYVRLAKLPRSDTKRFYTPHGGSLHYSRTSPIGAIFLALERFLMSRSDGIIFESEYAQSVFETRIGTLTCGSKIIHNGVRENEFEPIQTIDNPNDFVFVGELRDLKGVAILLEAIQLLHGAGNKITATIVGAGPDREKFLQLAKDLNIETELSFPGAMPAREAFGLGRILVVPSLHESLPYIILEAGAAGIPVIATDVGGIPEIFGPLKDNLVKSGDAAKLAAQMKRYLGSPGHCKKTQLQLNARIREKFSANHMAAQILEFYKKS